MARLTRTLGGQLRVESTAGHGSRFTIILPFRTDQPQTQEAASPETSLRRANSRGSMGSKSSVRSGSSGQASEIDSLVEAISADHMKPSNWNQHSPSTNKRSSSMDEQSIDTAGQHYSRPPPTTVGLNKPPPDSPGSVEVEGSQFPLRPVRVQDTELDSTTAWHRSRASGASTTSQAPMSQAAPPTPPETPSEQSADQAASQYSAGTFWKPVPHEGPPTTSPTKPEAPRLNILVVEDDPINRAILQRKLVKDGHTVQTAVHGEDGIRKFEADPSLDIILMDLQYVAFSKYLCTQKPSSQNFYRMPVCSGQDAAKRIRAFEKERENSDSASSRLGGHIPIFAVSASLYEKQRPEMLECGMDGWILKPINFDRLKTLLMGTTSAERRTPELYQ